MKYKLLYAAIALVCLCSLVYAGLLSVYRSKGEVLNAEQQAKLEEFFEQFKGEETSDSSQ